MYISAKNNDGNGHRSVLTVSVSISNSKSVEHIYTISIIIQSYIACNIIPINLPEPLSTCF